MVLGIVWLVHCTMFHLPIFWVGGGGGGGGGVDYSIRRYSSERRPFSSLSEGFFYEHMVALDTFMHCAPRHWQRNIIGMASIVYFQCLCGKLMSVMVVQCRTSAQRIVIRDVIWTISR
jgi:hypothetical protein